ncbi:hypothetical protein EJ08DRAFT_672711 [Tothia fuscella]|uniref:Lytic polysaccharide monooxygenase n=1 Tax=Tothia fuscella TaxID=1048955 RepID=A0A9P4TUV4_9PEZI|nr:hypothetical protein EJ08DRAFT_672711 [Tothia fuscella]
MSAPSVALLAALFGLFAGTSAHAVLNTPHGFPGLDPVINGPLGLQFAFPCQYGPNAKYDFSNATQVAAGQKTLLSLIGSAVHGGGSCQVAIAKKPSSDPKDWKVIQTMIGGCPSTVTVGLGNLDTISESSPIGRTATYPNGKQCASPDSDETDCVKSYNIAIPKDIASGKYFFSWSWFNKIGNREMYQNCAPIEVTNGASNDDYYNNLPSIFLANVDSKPCTTADNGPEKGVLDIPNPGDNVLRSAHPKDATSPAVLGSCAQIYGVAGDKAAPSPNAPAASSPSAPSPSAPVSSAQPAAPSSAKPAAPPAQGNSADCAAGEQKCSPDGALICISATQFAICNHGCALPQAVAAGTTCSGAAGAILVLRRVAIYLLT